jgi:serine/threonine protein kinase
MEFVDGPNLDDAVEGRLIDGWEERLRIAFDLARIIQAAHSVPERVLHRDIRPANIMLKNFFKTPDQWELVVLDFDLSWHRDASEVSLDLSKSMNSYLAPEQIQPARRKATRSALVDSYGFGMTMYFLASGENPAVGQHLYENWKKHLEDKISKLACASWLSLPRRFARLIDKTTKDSQTERWDMARIIGELGLLQQAISGSTKVTSPEIFAEEMVARCPGVASYYDWNPDLLAATIELRSGFTLKIAGDETNRLVRIRIDWIQTGDRKFENVRRWIGTATDKSVAALKKGSWQISNKGVTASACHIEALCTISDLQKKGVLDAASKGLSAALECLRLA